MNTDNTPEEKDHNPKQQDEQKALEEIWAIRNANYERIHSRVADFDTNDVNTPLSEIPMHTQMNVIHPDGATAMPIANAQEFVDAFLAAYSDGHGDFGLYESPQEADIGEDEERMRREFEYIMEMQERAGIEFDDYEEAKAWEQAEYGKDDVLPDEIRDSGLTNKEIQSLRDMSEIRGEKPEKTFNRLEQIELQGVQALTAKKGSPKQVSIENEINELEEAIKNVQAMEILDEAQVNEIEVRILDLARRTGIEDLKKYGFDLER